MEKEQLVRQMVEYASGLIGDNRNLVDFIDRRKEYDGWSNDDVKVFNNVFQAVKKSPESERELIVKNYATNLQDSVLPRELEVGVRQAGKGILSTLARVGSAIPVGDARGYSTQKDSMEKVEAAKKKQLTEYADQLNRESGILSEGADIANQREGANVEFGRNLRGAVSSIAQATATGWAGPYATIAGFMATEGNAAITDAKDAGLNSYDTFKYAGRAAIIEGTVASIFQKIGLGGFEKYFGGGKTLTKSGLKGFLKSTGRSMLEELPEEIITEMLHSANRALSEVDPNALEPEVLFETVKSTIAQTLLAVGATATVKGASEQEFLKNREELVASTSEKWGLAPEIVESAIIKSQKVKGDKDVAFGRELLSAALQTERGVVTWMATYPEKAVALLGNENPSRKDFEELGLPGMSEEGRKSFVKQINDIMEEDINPEPEDTVTPTQTGQPVADKAPVEPVAVGGQEVVQEENIPSVEDIMNAGEADVLAEISGSLKAIAEAVNPDSEVTVETASRSLKEDTDRLVADGMLAEEDKDDFISQKLAEAGLAPDIDPTQVDAAGRNYLTDEKAVISLTVLNADPTTAIHEAVETKIKNFFSDSNIESDEEMQAFKKSVIELGLPNYNNDKGMLEWMSDFLTDYVFASQNLRSMTGDEKANEVWDLVKQWRAKSKPGGRLAQMFDQLRQWFKETVGRAKQLRKALYSNPNNVDISFADKILASEMNPDFGSDIETDTDVSYQLRSRPGAYAKAVAAYTDGDKSSFQLEQPTIGVGKMTGGYLIPKDVRWNNKAAKSAKRAVEKAVRSNKTYQQLEEFYLGELVDLPSQLIEISKQDAGEYFNRLPNGYRQFFVFKENKKAGKQSIPWDIVLQRWNEQNASIPVDLPVDDFMDEFVRQRIMHTQSKGIIDEVLADGAKFDGELAVLAEKRKLVTEEASAKTINKKLVEFGEEMGFDKEAISGELAGKADILVKDVADKPIVQKLQKELTKTQKALLKERYAKKTKRISIKKAITESINPAGEKTITPAEALKAAMAHEAKGSLAGWKAGRIDLTVTQKDLTKFIKENLPLSERGWLLSALVNATTDANVAKVAKAVQRVHDNYTRRIAIKRFKLVKKGVNIKKLRSEYQALMNELLSGITESTMSDKVRKRLSAMVRASRKEGVEIDPDTVQDAVDRLDLADGKSLQEMDADTINAITDTILHIVHLNNLKNSLIFGNRTRQLDDFANIIVKTLGKRKDFKSDGRTDAEKNPLVSFITEGHTKADLLAYIIDGGDRNGAASQVFYKDLKDGERIFLRMIHQAEDSLIKVIEKAGLSWGGETLLKWSKDAYGKNVEYIKTKIGNKEVELTRAERVGLLASLMDPDTRQVIKKHGLKLARLKLDKPMKVQWKDIKAFEDSATDQELSVANGLRAVFHGDMREQADRAWQALLGYPKFTRPGYWPRSRDRAGKQQNPGEALNKHFGAPTLEGVGIGKDRVGDTTAVLIEDAFTVYMRTTRTIAAVTGMAIPIRNARYVLGNPEVHRELSKKFGTQVIDYLEDHLDTSTMIGVPDTGDFYKIVARLMNKIAPGILKWRLTTSVKQYLGLTTASIELGNGVYKDFAAIVATKGEMARIKALMDKYSPELKQRYRIDGMHLMSPYFDEGRAMLGRKPYSEKGMISIEYPDRQVVTAIFRNIERKTKKAHPDMDSDALYEAVCRETERIVNETQNTTSPIDLSGYARKARKNPMVKLGVMFMSQANSIVNLTYRSYYDYRNGKSLKKLADANAKLGVSIAGSVMVNTLVYSLLRIGRRKEEEPKKLADYLERIVYETLGNFFYGRAAVSMIKELINASVGKQSFSEDSSVIYSATKLAALGAGGVIRALTMEDKVYESGPFAGERKSERELIDAMFMLLRSAALFSGTGSAPIEYVEQILKTIDMNTVNPVDRKQFIGAKFYQLTTPEPKKSKDDTDEEFKVKQEKYEKSLENALDYLDNMEFDKGEAIEALKATAKSRGYRTDGDAFVRRKRIVEKYFEK